MKDERGVHVVMYKWKINNRCSIDLLCAMRECSRQYLVNVLILVTKEAGTVEGYKLGPCGDEFGARF